MGYEAGYRGESKHFLHDVITQIRLNKLSFQENLPSGDRLEMVAYFREELEKFAREFEWKGKKTFIVIDGLDHIEREQQVEYSLLKDLPLPAAVPKGVYFILGSRTFHGLAELNTTIKLELGTPGRTVAIAPFSRAEVFNVVKSYDALALNEQQKEDSFTYTLGHPLFLRYTIERLLAVPRETYSEIIAEQTFTGDIHDTYLHFWSAIRTDDDFKDLLGVISRFRFAFMEIRVLEDDFSFSERVLNDLSTKAGHFFYKHSAMQWQYFHNSFKWFLEKETATHVLSGTFNTARDEYYHTMIAQAVAGSLSDYRWNELYHLFKARQYASVLALATQDYFREQWYTFRNYKWIDEDISLSARAAFHQGDRVALLRYLLCSSELSQRLYDFKPQECYDIFLSIGREDIATSYIFDGKKLQVNQQMGLEFAASLFDAGKTDDAGRFFDLAEPVYILHHSREVSANRYDQETMSEIDELKLLESWAIMAVHYYPISEIFTRLENITVNDDRYTHSESTAAERREGLLMRCFRGVIQKAIEKEEYGLIEEILKLLFNKVGYNGHLIYVLLDVVQEISDKDTPLQKWCTEVLEAWPKLKDPYLKAELATICVQLIGRPAKAVILFKQLPLPEKVEKQYNYNRSDLNYLFSYARLDFTLNRSYDKELDEFIDLRENAEYRPVENYLLVLARHYGQLFHQQYFALSEFYGLFKDMLRFYHKGFREVDYTVLESRSYVVKRFILFAYKHSAAVLAKTLELLAEDIQANPRFWKTEDCREVVKEAWDLGAEEGWVVAQLAAIDRRIVSENYKSNRTQQCVDQARIWLHTGNLSKASDSLMLAFSQSIGISGEKDEQLESFVYWLEAISQHEPVRTKERLQYLLARMDFIRDTTSSAHWGPLLNLITMALKWNRAHGAELFKWAMLNGLTSFPEAFENVLEYFAEADGEHPEVYSKLFSRLLLFLQGNSAHGHHLIAAIAKHWQTGQQSLDLVDEVQIYGIQEKRNAVISRIITCDQENGLNSGLNPDDYPVKTDSGNGEKKYSLELKDEQVIPYDEVFKRVNSYKDIKEMMGQEARTSSFPWPDLLKRRFDLLADNDFPEILAMGTLGAMELAELGEELLVKGKMKIAAAFATKALEKGANSGWVRHFDGGSKLKAYALLGKSIDKSVAHELAFKDIAFSLDKLPGKYLFENFKEIKDLIGDEPAIRELYREVENYIHEALKSAVITLDAPKFESPEMTLEEALAEILLFLYQFPLPDMRGHIEAIMVEEYQRATPITLAFLHRLRDNRFEFAYVRLLTAIFLQGGEVNERMVADLIELTRHKQYDVAQYAYALLGNMGVDYDDEEIGDFSLPLVYQLTLDDKKDLIVPIADELERTRETESLRETTHPIQYLSYYALYAKILGKIARIPVINIAHRAMALAMEYHLPEWYNQLSEAGLRVLLDRVDMKYPYVRPRMLKIWPGMMTVVNELLKADYINATDAFHVCRLKDPLGFSIVTSKRPSFIAYLHQPGSRSSYRSEFNVAWVEKMGQGALENVNYRHEDYFIISSIIELQSLADGYASENHQSLVSRQDRYPAWRDYLLDDCQHYMLMENYPDYEGKDIVLFNYHETVSTKEKWIAINPSICYSLGWELSDEGNFRWLDENNDIMVESVYWMDGNVNTKNSFYESETGEGWFVIAAKEAVKKINEYLKAPLYIHRHCERTYIHTERGQRKQSEIKHRAHDTVSLIL